jgi:tetratricopeptide (TPR) repeat protein
MKYKVVVAVAVLAVLIGGASLEKAFAGDPEQMQCLNSNEDLKTIIDACNAYLNQWAVVGETRAQILIALGRAYMVSGQFDQAVDAFDKAIKIDSRFVGSYIDRAEALRHLGRTDDALADFARALALRSEPQVQAAAYFDRGSLYASLGQYTEALQDLDNSIQLDAARASSFTMRGTTQLRLGKIDAALEDDTQAIVLSKQPHEQSLAYNDRCWARAVANRELDAALADCNEALKLYPESWAARNSRGFVQFRMGKYKEAISDYYAATAVAPKDASSYYVRGVAKLKTGDAAGAEVDIELAKSIDPKVADTYASYGVKP